MNPQSQQKAEHKLQKGGEMKRSQQKPAADLAVEKVDSKETAVRDLVSRLISPAVDGGGTTGGNPPRDSLSSFLSGPLGSLQVNANHRNQALLQLQQVFGNHAVRHAAGRTKTDSPARLHLQTKLKKGQDNTICEREADRVADRILSLTGSDCKECEEEKDRLIQIPGPSGLQVQRKAVCPECLDNKEGEKVYLAKATEGGSGGREVAPGVAAGIKIRQGGGQPISRPVRGFFESRFGYDFGKVRVHTDSGAANLARQLNAEAFTAGQDIFFDNNRYQPGTNQGKRLLAHELTHTIQQGAVLRNGKDTHRVSHKHDRLEQEAERVANRVVNGEARGSEITPGGEGQVQRFELPSVGEIIEGAESALNTAVEAGESAVQSVVETVESGAEAVSEAAGEAVDWILSAAGQEALAAANALAGLFGGSVIIRRGCIIITIPNIPLFPTFQKTLGETPPIGFFIPLIEGGTMIGPFPVAGMAGILVYGQGSIESAVGPGVIRNIRIELCPFRSRYIATAQLYAAAAIGPRLTLFGGLFGAVGTAIPTTPPIPIILIAQGGLRGTATAWAIGAIQNTVTVEYSRGTLTFDNITDFMAGALLQGDLDIFAALRLYDKIICQYVYRLGHWEAGRAWKLTVPIHASLSRGGGTGSVGPITHGPMPIKDIETAIRPLPTGWNCLSWAEIKQILCDNGVLPPDFCKEEGPPGDTSIQKKMLALGICKCVGDASCGGGKMYKKCFTVDKNDCDNKGELQKKADAYCNHDADLKTKCKDRPKCRFRHTDAKCPVKESECKDGYFGAGAPAVTPTAPCPVPVNYRQTKAETRGGGALYFEYKWDSSTGNIADLKDCEVGEHVSYPDGNPYVWPSPPWDGGSTPNPTIRWHPGTWGGLGDTHSTKGFKKPYKEAGFTATQYYRYKCPCTNSGKPVNLMGPISIVRKVSEKKNGKFKYTVTKSGKSNKIDPLP